MSLTDANAKSHSFKLNEQFIKIEINPHAQQTLKPYENNKQCEHYKPSLERIKPLNPLNF